MTLASDPTKGDAELAREPVANDNEVTSRSAPRRRLPPPVEPALPLTIGWRYSEARAALARALGEIAADLWLAGKLPLTEGHHVATIGHSHAALEDNTDQERDRQAEDLGA